MWFPSLDPVMGLGWFKTLQDQLTATGRMSGVLATQFLHSETCLKCYEDIWRPKLFLTWDCFWLQHIATWTLSTIDICAFSLMTASQLLYWLGSPQTEHWRLIREHEFFEIPLVKTWPAIRCIGHFIFFSPAQVLMDRAGKLMTLLQSLRETFAKEWFVRLTLRFTAMLWSLLLRFRQGVFTAVSLNIEWKIGC